MKLKLTPKDLIAAILLVGAFVLLALGIDTWPQWVIIGVAGAYGFAVAASKIRK